LNLPRAKQEFHMPKLTQVQPAPSFQLVNQADRTINLSDFAGQWLILYFYPKDNTPGCTTEAIDPQGNIAQTWLKVKVKGHAAAVLDWLASHAS
jgi:peroxiredoxin